MEQEEYISIIVPVYNSASTLRRTLDSALKTMDADCELIIVDDGSTDNSRGIAYEYADRDPRIIVIEQEHLGSSAARKNGVMSSSGDCILFLDSDDMLTANAISDLRAIMTPDCDILVANVSQRALNGTSSLLYVGHKEEITPAEYLKRILTQRPDFMLHGKLFRRRLFDVYPWETDAIMAGLFHRALLLSLICASKNKIVIAPSAIIYLYIRRPGSLSAMLSLRPEGIDYLWGAVKLLPLPKREFVQWSLYLLDKTLISRGIPIGEHFRPALELIEMAKGMELSQEENHMLKILGSRSMRLSEARRLVREGQLTAVAPHISFIVAAYNNFGDVRTTVESILDTGFRNIEVIVVDDGSEHGESVKINAYGVRYPRVHVRKHAAHKGLMQSRMTGMEMAKGHAVMFLNAGDTVYWEGVFNALNLVDTGADIALMGARMERHLNDFDAEMFVPSHAPRLKDDAKSIFTGILEKTSLPHSMCFGVGNLEFLRNIDLDCNDDDYGSDALWLLRIMDAEPKVAFTDKMGYVQHRSPGKSLTSEQRCRSELALGVKMLECLRKLGRLNESTRRSTAAGVTLTITRILAKTMKTSFFGMRKANALAGEIFSSATLCHFYNIAQVQAPDPAECISRAKEMRKML